MLIFPPIPCAQQGIQPDPRYGPVRSFGLARRGPVNLALGINPFAFWQEICGCSIAYMAGTGEMPATSTNIGLPANQVEAVATFPPRLLAAPGWNTAIRTLSHRLASTMVEQPKA